MKDKNKNWNKDGLSYKEGSYLFEIFKGLFLTNKIFWQNLWTYMRGERGSRTVYYPEERRPDYAHSFRGHHYLTKTESGRPKCIACKLCAIYCPAACITVTPVNAPKEDTYSPKLPDVFDIDYSKCVFCGYCVEVCPKDAIHMHHLVPKMPQYTMKDLIYNKEILLDYSPAREEEKVEKLKKGAAK